MKFYKVKDLMKYSIEAIIEDILIFIAILSFVLIFFTVVRFFTEKVFENNDNIATIPNVNPNPVLDPKPNTELTPIAKKQIAAGTDKGKTVMRMINQDVNS